MPANKRYSWETKAAFEKRMAKKGKKTGKKSVRRTSYGKK